MSPLQKVRSVARNLEQMIEELPIFLLRLEEVTAVLDEKLEWREFKFCFKVGTSKVVRVVSSISALFYHVVFVVGRITKISCP